MILPACDVWNTMFFRSSVSPDVDTTIYGSYLRVYENEESLALRILVLNHLPNLCLLLWQSSLKLLFVDEFLSRLRDARPDFEFGERGCGRWTIPWLKALRKVEGQSSHQGCTHNVPLGILHSSTSSIIARVLWRLKVWVSGTWTLWYQPIST